MQAKVREQVAAFEALKVAQMQRTFWCGGSSLISNSSLMKALAISRQVSPNGIRHVKCDG
jgi:hypothetical protein